jgi:nickel-dependent lactate racemase
MEIANPFGSAFTPLLVPDSTHLVTRKEPERIRDTANAIRVALETPIDSEPLSIIARCKLKEAKNDASAVIVVSDNTRPVPYTGEEGILFPIIETLLGVGYAVSDILILIATGMHRNMSRAEIEKMIDRRVLELGICIENHDCTDTSCLCMLGKTKRGTEIEIDRRYMRAGLKIATGLVESHFMAGASGGRKTVCPGLIGEKSFRIFHGAEFMADEDSRDLNLNNNKVHEEALEIAAVAGIDFLVNVTLDSDFHITGIFTGNFIGAHEAAVARVKTVVEIPAPEADIVLTHGGFVGVNHYQCAKCAVASLGILKESGYLVIMADAVDAGHAVGSLNYRTALALLTLIGYQNFLRLIKSPDWTFLPEQWQVQMWTRVFKRIPMDHLIVYAPQISAAMHPELPGINGDSFLSVEQNSRNRPTVFSEALSGALDYIRQKTGKPLENQSIAWINDGPYVIPIAK